MNTNPYERISRNIHQFEEAVKTNPDVIFLTRKFYAELVHYGPSFDLRYMSAKDTLFGMKYFTVGDELDGLDFQCFKSSHLNALVERYNRDNRCQTYELEIYVPTLSTYGVSCISNGSAAPTIADMDPLKRVKIVVPNAVLRTWTNEEVL